MKSEFYNLFQISITIYQYMQNKTTITFPYLHCKVRTVLHKIYSPHFCHHDKLSNTFQKGYIAHIFCKSKHFNYFINSFVLWSLYGYCLVIIIQNLCYIGFWVFLVLIPIWLFPKQLGPNHVCMRLSRRSDTIKSVWYYVSHRRDT